MIRGICDSVMNKIKCRYAFFAASSILDPENKYIDGVLDGMGMILNDCGIFSEVESEVIDKIKGVIK